MMKHPSIRRQKKSGRRGCTARLIDENRGDGTPASWYCTLIKGDHDHEHYSDGAGRSWYDAFDEDSVIHFEHLEPQPSLLRGFER